jgi:hypothetical protein
MCTIIMQLFEHRSAIDILTILITLYGGFVIISRWIAGAIMKLIKTFFNVLEKKCCRYCAYLLYFHAPCSVFFLF